LKNPQYFFLLGGYDLEMLEIKKILDSKGELYLDKNLQWGAKLSHYQDDLDRTDIQYVGIELIEDIVPPKNYLAIDHHNERSHEPASIEQLAKLLNIQLNRYQQLVAANDKGYIPAMQEMGATDIEIQQVRRADRHAQGVTPEMEIQAKKDLGNRKAKKGVILIKTQLTKFSPIVDRINAKRLLVYNEETLCYYGQHAQDLSKLYPDLIKEQKAYSGGGKDGFWGIASGFFNSIEIEGFVKKIVQFVNGKI